MRPTSLTRISEISQSYIVVDGNAAIVGVTFDASYRGGLTERISSMVRQKLVTLDSSLQDVRVTAEPEQVKADTAVVRQAGGRCDHRSGGRRISQHLLKYKECGLRLALDRMFAGSGDLMKA